MTILIYFFWNSHFVTVNLSNILIFYDRKTLATMEVIYVM